MAKFDVNKIIEESLNEASLGEKIYDKLHPEDPNSPENIAFKHAQGFSKASSEGDVEKTRAHAAGLRRFFSKGDSKEADQLRQETIRDANAKTSKAVTYGSEEYNKLAKQHSEAGTPEAMKKAVESDNAKELSKVSNAASKEAQAAMDKEAAVASEVGRKALAKNAEAENLSKASKTAAKEAQAAMDKEAAVASEVGRKALAKNAEETQGSVLSHLGKSARKVGDDIQSGVKSFGHKVGDHLGNLDYGKTGMLAGGAIAAGLGALALRRRMKKAQKG